MGEDTRQIEETIREERSDLGRNLHELQSQARALADWRTHYRRHTGVALGAAFAGGIALGFASRGGRTHAAVGDLYETEADFRPEPATVPHPSRLAALRHVADSPKARRQIGEAWDGILSSLVGVGTTRLISWLNNFVPGFEDEFSTRRGSRPSDGHSASAR